MHAPHPHPSAASRFAVAVAVVRSPAASRARPCSASLQPCYEPTTRPSTGSQARSAASTDRAGRRGVTLHLLTHAHLGCWVARTFRLPAVLVVQRARLRGAPVDLWPSVCPWADNKIRVISRSYLILSWAGLADRSALLTPCLSLDVPLRSLSRRRRLAMGAPGELAQMPCTPRHRLHMAHCDCAQVRARGALAAAVALEEAVARARARAG